MAAEITKNALGFVCEHEGFYEYVYCNDGSGRSNPTIGFGTLLINGKNPSADCNTSLPGEWGPLCKSLCNKVRAKGWTTSYMGNYKDITITKKQAVGLMYIEFKRMWDRQSSKLSQYNLNSNQMAAYIDSCYQWGEAGKLPKAILSALASGGVNAVPAVFDTVGTKYKTRNEHRKKMWLGQYTATKYIDALNECGDLSSLAAGSAGSAGSGGDASGGYGSASSAGGGVSKFWYLGAVHNLLNNAQLEKLYVEVKLRGCNLSILRGEKVPMLIIDNKHKTQLLEQDNPLIDPTTMMDTWCSGWFMIGGYSYIYDPVNNGNQNKWTTVMKLQRMEWPTPTEVTDPSARLTRTLRYNLYNQNSEFKLDEGVQMYGSDLNSEFGEPGKVGTTGLDDIMKQLLKIWDSAGIKYKLVSARRYPINENGEIVKEKKPANVKFSNTYAFKCANDVRFFSSPVSDHSWGQGIDIIQADGDNFNNLLADIIGCEEGLIHMYKNGITLFEEYSTDDIGAATSHFHVGTLISYEGAQDVTNLFKNWWEGIFKINGTWKIGNYNVKDYIKYVIAGKNKIALYSDNQIWTLKKIYSTDANWQNQSFGAKELSFDDWNEKVMKTLQQEYQVNKTAAAKGNDSSINTKPSLTPEEESKLLESLAILPPESIADAAKLSPEDVQDIDIWDTYKNDCIIAYNKLDNIIENYLAQDLIKITDERVVNAIDILKKCTNNIKIVLDNNPTVGLLNNDIALQKRNNLEAVYRNSLVLIDSLNKYINKANVDLLLNLTEDNDTEGSTGTQTITLFNTDNLGGTITLDKIYDNIHICENIYFQQANKVGTNLTRFSINTLFFENKENNKWKNVTQFLADVINKIRKENIIILQYGVDVTDNFINSSMTNVNSTLDVIIYDNDVSNPNKTTFIKYVMDLFKKGELYIKAWTTERNILSNIEHLSIGLDRFKNIKIYTKYIDLFLKARSSGDFDNITVETYKDSRVETLWYMALGIQNDTYTY